MFGLLGRRTRRAEIDSQSRFFSGREQSGGALAWRAGKTRGRLPWRPALRSGTSESAAGHGALMETIIIGLAWTHSTVLARYSASPALRAETARVGQQRRAASKGRP